MVNKKLQATEKKIRSVTYQTLYVCFLSYKNVLQFFIAYSFCLNCVLYSRFLQFQCTHIHTSLLQFFTCARYIIIIQCRFRSPSNFTVFEYTILNYLNNKNKEINLFYYTIGVQWRKKIYELSERYVFFNTKRSE